MIGLLVVQDTGLEAPGLAMAMSGQDNVLHGGTAVSA